MNKSKGNSKNFRFTDTRDSKLAGLSASGTLNHLTNFHMDDNDEVEDENVDHVDNYVNYSCTLDDEEEVEIPYCLLNKSKKKNMKIKIGV
ncbi:hypothetical protein A2U01_0046378 [Trifolium medium]|uniref:Uncharacterized protein n=1 Tax=Trifolium medium TaxID=97028 RepID=A0A392QMM0_9FABA|nr:hypothetical protein [Trifolium medium]